MTAPTHPSREMTITIDARYPLDDDAKPRVRRAGNGRRTVVLLIGGSLTALSGLLPPSTAAALV
jgi:hypothetical protein